MGFRVQLIAVRGKAPAVVQREFGVSPTGEHEEIADAPVVGATLPNGAYLLYVNDPDRIVPNDAVYAKLSKGASLIACYANETVMNSFACAWANGAELWSVFHDAQQGIDHLETTGALPPEFGPLRDRFVAEQQGADGVDFVFEIPIELFAALGGVRYDFDLPDAGPEPWEILEGSA